MILYDIFINTYRISLSVLIYRPQSMQICWILLANAIPISLFLSLSRTIAVSVCRFRCANNRKLLEFLMGRLQQLLI